MGTSQRRVGASGLVVSAAGLGCNNFGRAGTVTQTLEGTRAVIDAALANGVFFFDTADMYGAEPGSSEALMGEALEGRRDRVVLATKFGHARDMGYDFPGGRGSRRYVRFAVEQSTGEDDGDAFCVGVGFVGLAAEDAVTVGTGMTGCSVAKTEGSTGGGAGRVR